MQIEKSVLEENKKNTDREGSFLFSEERCVMCGAVIPEGRQVCIECEEKIMSNRNPEDKRDKGMGLR